jgi:hypothetical protein
LAKSNQVLIEGDIKVNGPSQTERNTSMSAGSDGNHAKTQDNLCPDQYLRGKSPAFKLEKLN